LVLSLSLGRESFELGPLVGCLLLLLAEHVGPVSQPLSGVGLDLGGDLGVLCPEEDPQVAEGPDVVLGQLVQREGGLQQTAGPLGLCSVAGLELRPVGRLHREGDSAA
jgi:hypothetical protein